MRSTRSLIISITILLLLHYIIPYFTGTPVSVDSWPLIHIARDLYYHPEKHVLDLGLWDKWNNRWPSVILSTTLVSKVTGVEVEDVYTYILNGMVTLTFFLAISMVIRKIISDSSNCSTIAAYISVGLPPILVFSLSPLKEVYSWSLLAVLLVLTYTHSLNRGILFLTGLVSLGLVLSHPMSPLIILGLISTFILLSKLNSLTRLSPGLKIDGNIYRTVLVLASMYVAYNYIVNSGDKLSRTIIGDYLPVYLLYYVAFVSLYLIGSAFLRNGKGRILTASLIILIAIASVSTGLAPRIESLKSGIHLYIISFIVALLPSLSVRCEGREDVAECRITRLILSSGLVFLSSLVGFVFTYGKILVTVVHRIINYSIPILGVGTGWFCRKGGLHRTLSIALFLTVMFLSAGSIYQLVSGSDAQRYTWVYREPEIYGFNYIMRNYDGGLYGDQKVYYYTRITYPDKVTVPYRMAGGQEIQGCFIFYKDNFKWGLWIDPTIVVEISRDKNLYNGNLYFNNGYTVMVCN